MAKASIITLHTTTNYGSLLQTYATQYLFEKLGYDVEIIDYWRKNNQVESVENRILATSTMRQFEKFWGVSSFTQKLVSSILRYYIVDRHPTRIFLDRRIKLSPKRYYSVEQLHTDPPIADLYVTGSDQVWNSVWNEEVDMAFFLPFVPNNSLKIAYSASFGRVDLSEKEKTIVKNALKEYNFISVRELSAVDMLKEMGLESHLLLDPTLMLKSDIWRKFATFKRKKLTPYLLVYQLEYNDYMDSYAEKLANENNWNIVRIAGIWHRKARKGIFVLPSVEEFVGMIDNAELIVTDSFHATAFSLNLNKEFIVFRPSRFDTRVESLLRLTDTMNRIVDNNGYSGKIDKGIDYEYVNSVLNRERENGLCQLMQVIKTK